MKPLPFVIGLAAALCPSIGFALPPGSLPTAKQPRQLTPADHERIAAAQAKRERKAARLVATMGAR